MLNCMALPTALNNLRLDFDKLTYLHGCKASSFTRAELDQTLRMIGDNPNKYQRKEDKLDAIIYYYTYKTYYR